MNNRSQFFVNKYLCTIFALQIINKYGLVDIHNLIDCDDLHLFTHHMFMHICGAGGEFSCELNENIYREENLVCVVCVCK